MTTTTRRAVLPGAVAATAFSVAALPAVAMPLEPDPIFAAIEAHKAAWYEFALLDNWLMDRDALLDKAAYNKLEAKHGPKRDRLWQGQLEFAYKLIETTPTTMVGIIALLDYVERVNAAQFRLPDSRPGKNQEYVSGPTEWPESVGRDDLPNWNGSGPRTMDFHEALCRHVLLALHSLAPVNVAALDRALPRATA